MQGKKNYSERLFTSFQFSDWVPEDNFYRRVKSRLDLGWVYKATSKYYGTEGQQSIDPVVFFKLILIGYLENINSDRKIIQTAAMRMDMLFFIGYDLGESLPWHSTLSRTRQLYGQEVFRQLFAQVLKQCIELGMVCGRRQAVDSALIKANASMDSLLEKQVLQDGDAYVSSLKGEEEEGKAPSPKVVKKKKTRTLSSTDPDARLATKPGKPYQLYYLGQVSADTHSHVITNIAAHHADKRDSECLAQVLEGAQQMLQEQGMQIEEVLADTNYSSGRALAYLEDEGIKGYIPNCGPYQSERKGFTYCEDTDSFTCTQGVTLSYKKTFCSEGNWKKEYASTKKDCAGCPLLHQCAGKKQIKRLTVTVHKPLYERMAERMKTTRAQRMKKLRQSTIEPILGSLINYTGMRRLNTRGIKLAEKCLLMAAACYNLKKLLKFKGPKVEVAIKMMENLQQRVQKQLLLVKIWFIHPYNLYRC